MPVLNEGSVIIFYNKENVLNCSSWMEICLFCFQTQLYERRNVPVGDRLTHQSQSVVNQRDLVCVTFGLIDGRIFHLAV